MSMQLPLEPIEAAVNQLTPDAKPVSAPGPEDFDWMSEDVVIPTQPAIAVYLNRCDEIVIRQEAPYPDEDQFIRIRRENLWPLIHRLTEIERDGK